MAVRNEHGLGIPGCGVHRDVLAHDREIASSWPGCDLSAFTGLGHAVAGLEGSMQFAIKATGLLIPGGKSLDQITLSLVYSEGVWHKRAFDGEPIRTLSSHGKTSL